MPALSYKINKLSSIQLAEAIAVGKYTAESFADIKAKAVKFASSQEASLLRILQELQGVSRLLPSVEGIGTYRYMVDKVVDTQYDYEVTTKDLFNGVLSLEDERDTSLLGGHPDIYKKMSEIGLENYAEMPSEDIIPQVQISLEEFLGEQKFALAVESYLSRFDETIPQETLMTLHDKLRGLFHHSADGLEAVVTLRHEIDLQLPGEYDG